MVLGCVMARTPKWQVIRPLLPIPTWPKEWGGRPEGYRHRVLLGFGTGRERRHRAPDSGSPGAGSAEEGMGA
ncbi:hypothetical protein GCM10022403_008010 [Streptomyces coacervatus]|uniref:Uncharacterized protein n=1 Tax=Streptomyces coacervatus TaxID=647381 RepID=A0ABP7GTL7_9ACTN